MINEKQYIDHEVRIRELENICEQIDQKLNWILAMLGGILTSIVIPVLLHSLKLI